MGSALSVRATNGSDVTERARHGAKSAIRTGGCMGTFRYDVQRGHAGIDAKRQNAIAQHTARPHKP
jgi:hypothetical protein